LWWRTPALPEMAGSLRQSGHYNPRTDPPTIVIKEDRALYWLSKGAQPTDAVARMLEKMGTFEKLKRVHQGVSIEELVAPPEPEVEQPAPEAEPALEAEEVVAEAEAIVEAAVEEVEPVAEELGAPAEEQEPAEAVAVEDVAAEEEEAPEATELEETVGAGEMSLEDLGLSTRLINVLAEAGVETVQDILTTLAKGDAEFLSSSGGWRQEPGGSPRALD